MISNGYYLKNDFSNVAISKINIYNILGKYNDLKYNYCSSVYKDAGQLKERLLRIARKNKKFYETITKEGTFIYIVIILLKRNIFDFIKKYLLKEKYFISNKIDDQIIKYLNISETKISLYSIIKINKRYINHLYFKLNNDINNQKKYDLSILMVEQYPYENGFFVEMSKIL